MLATWKQGRPLLPAVIVISCLIGLVTSANGVSTFIKLDGPPGTVTVCREFDVPLTIGHAEYTLGTFVVTILFDPDQVEYRGAETKQNGWILGLVELGDDSVRITATADTRGDVLPIGYQEVLVLTFHCRGPGTSTIQIDTVQSPPILYTFERYNGGMYSPDAVYPTGEFTQVEAKPVGGVVVSTSKLEILTPYLALAGLVIAVSAVVIVRKRR